MIREGDATSKNAAKNVGAFLINISNVIKLWTELYYEADKSGYSQVKHISSKTGIRSLRGRSLTDFTETYVGVQESAE